MKKVSFKHVAHWLIPLRFEHSQIFKFSNWLILLLIFIGCSKKDNNEPVAPSTPVETPAHLKDWTPQPKVDVAQPYMVFATGNVSATTLSLTAVGSTATATDVWVDTNNNGVFDEGIDKRITDFTKPITFKVTDKVFTIYGKVKELNATGNALTAADVRKNEALTKLNIADNWLEEKALLDLVKSLPTATGTTEVVLHRAEGDGNAVTDAVLIAAKQRGWQTLKIKDNKETPDLPADTKAPKAGAITEATATAFNTLSLKWTAATDNKTATGKLRYQVLYNVKGSSEVKTSEVKENMLALTLTGLTEKTTYVVKVKVMDEAGNTAEYQAKEVTTPAAPEAADKEAPKAGAISKATATFNTLNLKWTAATDNKTVAGKLRYQVLYNVKGSSEVKTSEVKENMLALTLTGLTEKTTYIVKVKVMDEAGNATDYEAKEVTTAAIPAVPPTPSTIKHIEKLTYDKVKITWFLAQDKETPSAELRYQVFWKVEGTTDEKSSPIQTNIFEYTLTDLKENTSYEVWVKVWNKANLQAQYPPQKFTTDKKPDPYDALDKTNYIELTTDKPIGETIKLSIKTASYDEQKKVWIDLNNNGHWDKDIDVIPQNFSLDKVAYTVKAKTFRVYGKVNDFRCHNADNEISKVVLHNPALEIVYVGGNKLTTLTVPDSQALKVLGIADNPLTSLHIGKEPNLESLNVSSTNLPSLDISPYRNLKEIFVEGTPLTSLDASKNPLLKKVGIARYGGKGLIGTPLENFIKSLPAGKGLIYLSEDQKTPAIVNTLLGKDWKIK